MKILLSNFNLIQLAGSELATLELAAGLRARGHDVRIFALERGALADQAEERLKLTVLTPTEVTDLRGFAPDLLHIHHWPTVCVLQSLGVAAPWVIGFLGVLLALENPPPVLGQTPPWWSVSEEVQESVRSVLGWDRYNGGVIRNWFDDSPYAEVDSTSSTGIYKLLVVSNRFPEPMWSRLRLACDKCGIEVERVGLPDRPVLVNHELLSRYDGVVTLGRTAIRAMAMGKPVLVADHCGADGWVTPDNVASLALRNFSGRSHAMDPSPGQFMSWLQAPPSASQLAEVKEWAWRNCTLTSALDALQRLYTHARNIPVKEAFGAWVGHVSEYR